jgi:hypothetical protein
MGFRKACGTIQIYGSVLILWRLCASPLLILVLCAVILLRVQTNINAAYAANGIIQMLERDTVAGLLRVWLLADHVIDVTLCKIYSLRSSLAWGLRFRLETL